VSVFSVRCNIYISRLCYNVSVYLSVTEVHWCIIANLGFKFQSQFTAHCGRGLAVHAGASTELFIVQWVRGKGSSPGRVEGSSRATLATARPSCILCGSNIEIVDNWPHLGRLIRRDLADSADIVQSHNKLVTQVNSVLCTFSSLDAIVKKKLLKNFCLSHFGCKL